MKLINALIACLVASATCYCSNLTHADATGISSFHADGGTERANNTLTASGIALNNRVKMRGFVDFRYDYTNIDELVDDDDARFVLLQILISF